jgi:hypothetical protein
MRMWEGKEVVDARRVLELRGWMPSLFEAVHAFTQQDNLTDLKRKELPRTVGLGGGEV